MGCFAQFLMVLFGIIWISLQYVVERRVGLFYVERVIHDSEGEVKIFTILGIFRSYGIIYSREKPHYGGCEHLYGAWYRYTDDF